MSLMMLVVLVTMASLIGLIKIVAEVFQQASTKPKYSSDLDRMAGAMRRLSNRDVYALVMRSDVEAGSNQTVRTHFQCEFLINNRGEAQQR